MLKYIGTSRLYMLAANSKLLRLTAVKVCFLSLLKRATKQITVAIRAPAIRVHEALPRGVVPIRLTLRRKQVLDVFVR